MSTSADPEELGDDARLYRQLPDQTRILTLGPTANIRDLKTVTDRDRSKGTYFVRYADPESAKKQQGWLDKLAFWKDTTEKVEQYRISVAESAPPTSMELHDI